MIHFVAPANDDWTPHEYLSGWGRAVADRFRVVHYEDLAAAGSLERGVYVLAALCRLTDGMGLFLRELHGRLSREPGLRFLNDPSRTLKRLPLLEELARRGLNEFRAARATGDFASLRYPVFLRSERAHDGALSPLLQSPREVEAAVARAVILGRREVRDLLVVEFCDTADSDGYYRKYSAYVVGDRVLPRSMEYGRGWMLKHAGCEYSQKMLDEERAYVLANPHEPELSRIFAIAGIQYGRIDYAIKAGRVQTWEINLHPMIGRGPGPSKHPVPPELKPYREESKAIFHRGFQAAWEAVDLPSDGQPAIEIAVAAPEPRREAPTTLRPSLLDRARRQAPRPLRRLAVTLAAPLLPGLGRAALRRARVRSG